MKDAVKISMSRTYRGIVEVTVVGCARVIMFNKNKRSRSVESRLIWEGSVLYRNEANTGNAARKSS